MAKTWWLAAALVLLAPLVAAAEEFTSGGPAYRAEDFVETIGLSVSPFEIHEKDGKKGPAVAPELFFDLGVRYYRANLRCALTPKEQPQQMEEWWKKTGARPMMLVDPAWNRTLKLDWLGVKEEGDFSNFVDELKRYAPGLISGIEAPNELNNKFGQDMNLKYRGRTDEAAGTLYQADLYAAVKGDPATKDIPVIMYTAIFTDYTLARSTDRMDFLNTHSYQGDNVPSSSLLVNCTRTFNILPEGAEIKPFVPTECGYNVELDKTNGMGYTGSLRAQAYCEPMLFAEYFRHGIAREFLFALQNIDGYGLLESDNATRRPSWYGLQSLIKLLADAQWNPEKKEWVGGRAFAPRALRFRLEDAPPTVHTLTLQKENGDWYLLVWNEIRNQRDRADVVNPEVPATLTFAPETQVACAGCWRQGEIPQNVYGSPEGPKAGAFAAAPTPEVKNGRLSLKVPSRVVILRLTPQGKATTAKVAIPQLQGTAPTPDKITIAVTMPADADFAQVELSRLGMHIATLPRSAFKEKDGKLLAEWTDDSAWVRPGLGYPFTAVAVAADGAMGQTAKTVVKTMNRRCDLTVANLGVADAAGNANLKAGAKVRFAADVINAGAGPTPNPTTGEVGMYNSCVSVTFAVDGNVVGWGGNDGSRPMAPGEKQRFAAAGGPNGGEWTAVAGTHVVRAQVDDVGRIANETNKMNNFASRSFTVGDYPGRLEVSSAFMSGHADLSTAGTLDWVICDKWNDGACTRKRDANLIGAVKQDGAGFIGLNPGCGISLGWGADGTQAACADTHIGFWGNGKGNGYAFAVPAGEEEQVLKIYAGVTNGGHGELTVSLSDESAPAVKDASWNANRSNSWCPVPDEAPICFTVRFRAAKPGQKLRVRWGLIDDPNSYSAQLRLQGIALSR